MRLRDYLAGQRVQLRSPLSARAVAECINQAAGSAFSSFATGIIGWVWGGNVRLRYRSSLFEYVAKPILCGRIRGTPRGSVIDLVYRAPAWVYVFYALWYVFLMFFALTLAGEGWSPDVTTSEKVTTVATLAAFSAFPLGLYALGTHRSEEELARLLDFLDDEAEAQPCRNRGDTLSNYRG